MDKVVHFLKRKAMRYLMAVLAVVIIGVVNGNFGDNPGGDEGKESIQQETVLENGSYTSKEDVAQYLRLYGKLPQNYITKKAARDMGWDSEKGNLAEVAPGLSIGGDYFGNNEGILPEADGRQYYECDIDYQGGYRNSKRIVYSNDGLIFYTEDHYESFEPLN